MHKSFCALTLFVLLGISMRALADTPVATRPVYAYFGVEVSGPGGFPLKIIRTDPIGNHAADITRPGAMNVENFSASVDGSKLICFRTDNRSGRQGNEISRDMVILDSDGRILNNIDVSTVSFTMVLGPPSLLPDGRHIGFVATTPDPFGDANRLTIMPPPTVSTIMTLGIDGRDLKMLANSEPNLTAAIDPKYGKELNRAAHIVDTCEHAAWSPDGKTILCTFDTVFAEQGKSRLNRRIWAIDADGGNPRPIAPDQTCFASFSPDGRQIVYLTITGGTSEIFVADAGGAHARQVTHLGAILSSPRWLSDGKTIEFLRAGEWPIVHENSADTAWAVQADGSNPRQISLKTDCAMLDEFIDPYTTQMMHYAAALAK